MREPTHAALHVCEHAELNLTSETGQVSSFKNCVLKMYEAGDVGTVTLQYLLVREQPANKTKPEYAVVQYELLYERFLSYCSALLDLPKY